MRKTELQKTVDRILRALQPFKVEKRQKILNIVSEYISEDLIADDEDNGEDEELSGDDEAPDDEAPDDDDERSDALSAGSHLVQEKSETDMDISPEERRKRERNERDRERRAEKKAAEA